MTLALMAADFDHSCDDSAMVFHVKISAFPKTPEP